jgi:hypothetical protein
MESLLLFHRDAESVKSHPQSSMSENDKSLRSASKGFYALVFFKPERQGKYITWMVQSNIANLRTF